MKNTPELISLYDGKYAVKNNNGSLEVYRHGERWPEKEKQLIGDGFVLALVQALEQMKEAGKDSAKFTEDDDDSRCFQPSADY
jgi:hypothetical protein